MFLGYFRGLHTFNSSWETVLCPNSFLELPLQIFTIWLYYFYIVQSRTPYVHLSDKFSLDIGIYVQNSLFFLTFIHSLYNQSFFISYSRLIWFSSFLCTIYSCLWLLYFFISISRSSFQPRNFLDYFKYSGIIVTQKIFLSLFRV